MEKILFEIPVQSAIDKINRSLNRKFSYLYKGEMKEILISDTMKVIAKDPKCCFCEAKATRAFVTDNGNGKLGVKFFTEKNGKLVLFTKDHRIPRSSGGKNSFSNYQTSCQKCNMLKGDVSKNNDTAKLIIDLKNQIKNQKQELKKLRNNEDKLRMENFLLDNEISLLYSIWVVKVYFFIKKLLKNIIDKIQKI